MVERLRSRPVFGEVVGVVFSRIDAPSLPF
jgi:hypothetical protein